MAADVHATCRFCDSAEANGEATRPTVAPSKTFWVYILDYTVLGSGLV
jgi:hypothetical protein